MLALTPLLLAMATPNGTLDVRVDWDGGEAAACTVTVDGEAPAPPGSRAVAAGQVVVGASCPGDAPLVPPPVTVDVKAGATRTVTIKVRRARLRVEARRNGTMLASEVAFYAPGADPDADPPAFTRPANQRVSLAAGRYLAVVRLRAKDQPQAAVRLDRFVVKPGKNPARPVDLSDGGLVVQARNNRKRADGAVRVFRGETRVALGETGQEIRLPAGAYRVETNLREAVDFARVTETVWVQAGRKRKLKADFRTGRLRVEVRKDGQAIPATVRMKLPGAADFFNFFEAPGDAVVAPRTLNLSVSSPKARPLGDHLVKDVQVRAGRTNRVKIDLSPARLRLKVTKNGRPTPLARATVREPGGGQTVAIVNDGEARLWPGRYELLVALGDGAEQVDGPFEVGLAETVTRIVDFARARLRVQALRGATPEPNARVAIYRADASEPLYRVRPGEVVEVPRGTYDVKVTAGPDVQWRRRVAVADETELQVVLPNPDAAPGPDGEDPDDFELPEGDGAEED